MREAKRIEHGPRSRARRIDPSPSLSNSGNAQTGAVVETIELSPRFVCCNELSAGFVADFHLGIVIGADVAIDPGAIAWSPSMPD